MDTEEETTKRPIAIASGLRSGLASATILRNEEDVFCVVENDEGSNRDSNERFGSGEIRRCGVAGLGASKLVDEVGGVGVGVGVGVDWVASNLCESAYWCTSTGLYNDDLVNGCLKVHTIALALKGVARPSMMGKGLQCPVHASSPLLTLSSES